MNKIYRILTITMLVLGTSSFVNAAIWYSESGVINNTSNWWNTIDSSTSGTTHPANFNTVGDSFVVQACCYNTGTITMAAGTKLNILGKWNGALGTVGYIYISSGGVLYATSTLNIKNNWTNNGSFSNSNIYLIVNFNGSTNQTITTGGITSVKIFKNITINNTAATVYLIGDIKIEKDITITSGTLDANGYDIYLSGNWINNSNFNHTNRTIFFVGTLSQSMTAGGNLIGKKLYNVTIDKTGGTVTLYTDLAIDANLLINNSTSSLNPTSRTIYLSGNWTNNGTFYPGTSNVVFNGSTNQYINTAGNSNGKRFYNFIILSTGGITYLTNDLRALNDFTISLGSFDAAGFSINVTGSWINNGTFISHSNSVTFGASNNSVIINAGGTGNGKHFYNLIYNASSYTRTLASDIKVDGIFQCINGTIDVSNNNYSIFVDSNLQLNGGFNARNGTVYVTGTYNQVISISRSTNHNLYNLTINKTSGTVSLAYYTEIGNNLTLTSGTLDVTASSFNIYIGNSWINNGGTFNPRTGIVFFINSTPGYITGSLTSTFNRITVANTAPLIVNQNTTLSSQLTINSGSYLEVNPNITLVVQGTLANGNSAANDNHFIIRSTASGSGSLINSTTGQHATVERFVTGGAVGSTPPIPAIKHYVSTAITGLQGWILNDPTLGNYNVYTFSNIWERIFGTTAMLNGRGYLVNYNADRTIPFAGIMNTATINTTIYPTDGTYTLVGNPYPFALDCNAFMNNATNAANIYDGLYFWNQTIANDDGDYAWWSQTWGSGGGNAGVTPAGFIASGQGFMVANYQTSGSIQFTHDMNVAGNNNQFFIVEPSPLSRLSLKVVNPYGTNNEILVGFSNMATTGFDRKYDILKLKGNPDLALYTMMYDNNKDFVAQGLPPVTDREIIPVGLDAGIAGNYTFNLGKLEDFDEDVDIYLKDLQQQNTIDLRQTPAYSFYTEAGNIRDRFIIVFKNRNAPSDIPALNNEDVFIYSSAKTIHLTKTDISYLKGDLMVTDLMGRNVYSGKISGLQNYELKLDQPAGCYVVSLKDGGKVWVKKIWME